MSESVKVTRVYADAGGESHFGERDFPLRDAGEIGRLSEPVAAKSVIFRRNSADYDYDWHVAPRRQFIVLLDGSIEIETSDGARRTFRGGGVLLPEDTTGRGHRTRNAAARERRSLFIVLDDAGGI